MMTPTGGLRAHPALRDIVIEVHPFAERLRFKGRRMRYARDGQRWDYRVVAVSMPDEWGRCTLTVTPDVSAAADATPEQS